MFTPALASAGLLLSCCLVTLDRSSTKRVQSARLSARCLGRAWNTGTVHSCCSNSRWPRVMGSLSGVLTCDVADSTAETTLPTQTAECENTEIQGTVVTLE